MRKTQIEKAVECAFNEDKEGYAKAIEKLLKSPVQKLIKTLIEMGYKIKEKEIEEDRELDREAYF